MGADKVEHECINEDTLKDLKICMEQHNDRFHQGDLQFQKTQQCMDAILEGQEAIKTEQALTNKKLFVDNGTISIQTKIDRHNQLLKGMMWAITSISLVTAGIIGNLIIKAIMSRG